MPFIPGTINGPCTSTCSSHWSFSRLEMLSSFPQQKLSFILRLQSHWYLTIDSGNPFHASYHSKNRSSFSTTAWSLRTPCKIHLIYPHGLKVKCPTSIHSCFSVALHHCVIDEYLFCELSSRSLVSKKPGLNAVLEDGLWEGCHSEVEGTWRWVLADWEGWTWKGAGAKELIVVLEMWERDGRV